MAGTPRAVAQSGGSDEWLGAGPGTRARFRRLKLRVTEVLRWLLWVSLAL